MKKFFVILAIMLGAVSVNAQTPNGLQDITKSLTGKCPMDISEGLTMVSVALNDSTVLFEYNISDAIFENIADLGGILHDSLLAEMVSSPDPIIQALIANCKSTQTKIIDRFVNSEGKNFDILILPSEF